MILQLFRTSILLILTTLNSFGQNTKTDIETIIKIEMSLSAFGVESDDFPSINAIIDFTKDTSICTKSYYNPDYKGSTYSLSKSDLTKVLGLLKISV